MGLPPFTFDTWIGLSGLIVGLLALGLSVYTLIRQYLSRKSPLTVKFDLPNPNVPLRVGDEVRCTVTVRNQSDSSAWFFPPELEGKFHAGQKFDLEAVDIQDAMSGKKVPQGDLIRLDARQTILLTARHKAVRATQNIEVWYRMHRPGEYPPIVSDRVVLCILVAPMAVKQVAQESVGSISDLPPKL